MLAPSMAVVTARGQGKLGSHFGLVQRAGVAHGQEDGKVVELDEEAI
jgi:hypothetical protein